MKPLFLLAFLTTLLRSEAQFTAQEVPLPPEISYYDNQFSSLAVHNGRLFLMSESRLQDGAEGKLYAAPLKGIMKKMRDNAYALQWQKFHLYGLETLRKKIDRDGKAYEGLEAIVIDKNKVYLSVETATPIINCYLLQGVLEDTCVVMDTTFLIPLPKFTGADGHPVYNAGFESLVKKDDQFFAFYEYNYFLWQNEVYMLDRFSLRDGALHRFPIRPLPFRITDITYMGRNHFTAINYFFKGEGDDAVYRVPESDTAANRLILKNGKYVNYSRLIDIELKNDSFQWKPIADIPIAYVDYNWEGIAPYRAGYFIINDKYSTKPYRSTLLYLSPVR